MSVIIFCIIYCQSGFLPPCKCSRSDYRKKFPLVVLEKTHIWFSYFQIAFFAPPQPKLAVNFMHIMSRNSLAVPTCSCDWRLLCPHVQFGITNYAITTTHASSNTSLDNMDTLKSYDLKNGQTAPPSGGGAIGNRSTTESMRSSNGAGNLDKQSQAIQQPVGPV